MPNPNIKTGHLIKRLMKEYNLNQPQLGKIIGVTKSSISMWVDGKDISPDNLYLLAKFFDITVDELINGELSIDSQASTFDFNNIDLLALIENNDSESLEEFFIYCRDVYHSFYNLLPKWANNSLSAEEENNFNTYMSFFSLDKQYYHVHAHKSRYNKNVDELKAFVSNRVSQIQNLSSEEKEWEITKLFDFNIDIQQEKIMNSNNPKSLKALLSFLNPIQKDKLLTESLLSVSDIKSIENNEMYKILFNEGGHLMKIYSSMQSYDEEDCFKYLEGKTKFIESFDSDECFYRLCETLSNGKKTSRILYEWKNYSLQKYKEYIDYTETERLKSLVNDKADHPLKYLETLNRLYDFKE